jgi:membrane-bound metal-dependent hydrolase YbcI (DUF457 family)
MRAAVLVNGSLPWHDEMRAAQFWRLVAAAVLGSIAGYCSHLVLDGTTPKGLPLFVRGV